VIINKDKDIFASVVEHYSIDKSGEESKSSDKEKELKEIATAEALRCINILKL
jgi:formiminotetrahydrofolate cyclodeaminase